MNCSRCLGLMIEDQFLDMESQYGEMWARSLRCVNCGHVHDSVIQRHRLARQERSWRSTVMSRTIRMTKSILEPSPLSDEWPDPPAEEDNGRIGCQHWLNVHVLSNAVM